MEGTIYTQLKQVGKIDGNNQMLSVQCSTNTSSHGVKQAFNLYSKETDSFQGFGEENAPEAELDWEKMQEDQSETLFNSQEQNNTPDFKEPKLSAEQNELRQDSSQSIVVNESSINLNHNRYQQHLAANEESEHLRGLSFQNNFQEKDILSDEVLCDPVVRLALKSIPEYQQSIQKEEDNHNQPQSQRQVFKHALTLSSPKHQNIHENLYFQRNDFNNYHQALSSLGLNHQKQHDQPQIQRRDFNDFHQALLLSNHNHHSLLGNQKSRQVVHFGLSLILEAKELQFIHDTQFEPP